MWQTFSPRSPKEPTKSISWMTRLVLRVRRAFGRRPRFHSFRGPDGTPWMVDQMTHDHLRSTAPPPTRASLQQVVEGVSRVRVIGAGMAGDRVQQGPILLDVSDAEEIARLKGHLDIVEAGRFGHCMCHGWPTLELFAGEKRKAVIGLQHGRAIRWQGWKGDAPLANPGGLLEWMARLGATKPLEKFEEDRAREAAERNAWVAWLGAVPTSLADFRQVFERVRSQGDAGLDVAAVLRSLSTEFPDSGARIRALFRWFACGSGVWNGYPSYEEIPEMLLLAHDTAALVSAVSGLSPDSKEAEGASRLLAGWNFRRSREPELVSLDAGARALLLAAGSRSSDSDRLARARRAFGRP